jgi:hypothetical protein
MSFRDRLLGPPRGRLEAVSSPLRGRLRELSRAAETGRRDSREDRREDSREDSREDTGPCTAPFDGPFRRPFRRPHRWPLDGPCRRSFSTVLFDGPFRRSFSTAPFDGLDCARGPGASLSRPSWPELLEPFEAELGRSETDRAALDGPRKPLTLRPGPRRPRRTNKHGLSAPAMPGTT